MSVKESNTKSQKLSPKKGCAIMKNKLIRLLLIGLMVSTLLLGCGQKAGEKQASESQEDPPKDQTTTVTETTQPSETISETEPQTEPATTVTETTPPSETVSETEPQAEPVTIEEQILIDEAGIKITAQNFVTDGLWGSGVELLLENSTEQDAGIGCKALIVNNCMIDSRLLATVPAGEKITETLWLADEFLNAAGIETVGQVEVKFFVYDKETQEPLIKNDFVSIHTSAYENMEPVTPPEGTVLFEDQGVRILGNYSNVDPVYGSAVWLFAENQSDRNLNLISMNVTVNGTQVTSMCSGPVFKDKVSHYHLLIDLDELKEQGITDLKEIKIQFSFIDEDSGLMIAGPVDAVLEL